MSTVLERPAIASASFAWSYGGEPPQVAEALTSYEPEVWKLSLSTGRSVAGLLVVSCMLLDANTGAILATTIASKFSSMTLIGLVQKAGDEHGLPDRILVPRPVDAGLKTFANWGRSQGIYIVVDPSMTLRVTMH